MRHRHLFAIAIGVLAVVACQQGVLRIGRLIETCCIAENRSAVWAGIAMNLLFTIGILLPGFIAGLVARSRGILVGFLAGLVGGILYSAAFGFVSPVDWGAALTSGPMLLSLVGTGVTLSVSCAAAGGAAEALRSNTSLERTRGR
jgi:hypothetical protein